MKSINYLLWMFTLLAMVQCTSGHSTISTIEELCQIVGPTKNIIGLGESTHGTKEFTTYRTEIVKELVEKHNYRVFILEAEFIECIKMNDFLQTGIGDPKELLDAMNMWVWNNSGFLEMVKWMRRYNKMHPTDPVSFFGMDSQSFFNYHKAVGYSFSQENLALYSYVINDTLLQQYPKVGKVILEIEESNKDRNTKIKTLRNLAENNLEQTNSIDLKLQYYIQCRIHNLANIEPRIITDRDENMAKLVELIFRKTGKKSMIWAHNDHIFRGHNLEYGYIPLGYNLSKKYGHKYSVIGFDFKEGSFTAYPRDKKGLKSRTVCQYNPIIETFASQIDYKSKDFVINDCNTIESNFYVNVIGASYNADTVDVKMYTREVHNNDEFDYIISIPNSTPTEIFSE